MSSLKIIAQVLRHYFTWLHLISLLACIGFALVLISLVAVFYSPIAAGALFIAGIAIGLSFPFLASGIAFRALVSNRQLSLAPQFSFYALLGLLIMSLLVTLTPFFVSQFFDREMPILITIRIFCFASIFLGLCQLKIPPSFLWLVYVPLIFPSLLNWIIPDIPDIPDGTFTPLLHPAITFAFLFITLSGWAAAFFIVNKGQAISPSPYSLTTTFSSTVKLREKAAEKKVKNSQRLRKSSRPRGSLLTIDSLYENRLTYSVQNNIRINIPKLLVFVLAPLFFTLYVSSKAEDSSISFLGLHFNSDTFLFFNTLVSLAIMLIFATAIPRSRLLWLRYGNSRDDLWAFMQTRTLKLHITIFIFCSIVALALLLIRQINILQAMSYLTVIICYSPFYTYFPLFCRIKPGTLRTAFLILGMAISIYCLSLSIPSDNYPQSIFVSAAVLLTGLGFRFAAKKSFQGIDWLQVKPALLKNRCFLSEL